MGPTRTIAIGFILVLVVHSICATSTLIDKDDLVAKLKFPPNFSWGTATAAYQIEGAYKEGGRGPSIWDIFSHTPNKTANGDTGDVADDHYHRVHEDVQLMKQLGVKFYRFSLSWSRILPTGMLPLNPAGIAHYSKEIDIIMDAGLTPFVTLYHWDLPEYLHQHYGGWLNASMVEYFTLYADTCFQHFGDRVKYWLTFNEPLSFSVLGYGSGVHAPGRCSDRSICPQGNSSTEPYIVTHTVLNAHAAAVHLYREKYQKQQGGQIGITLNCDWAEPLTAAAEDVAAAVRSMEFSLAWFADPIFFGDYPQVMKERVKDRLPSFTEAEKQLLKGSHDFFGLNHYTSEYVYNDPHPSGEGFAADQGTASTRVKDGKLIGPQADSNWLYVVPWGIRKLLNWIAKRYDNPPIFITENGVDVPNETALPIEIALNDTFRVNYLRDYIAETGNAIQDGVNVKGYFVWSLMDNFEWADGYSKRFGIHYVDYHHGLKRYIKHSALWYRDFISANPHHVIN